MQTPSLVQAHPGHPLSAFPVEHLSTACANEHLRLNKVVDFMERHCDRPLSVDILAEVACFSKAHFTRLFKAKLGKSPHQAVCEQRIAYAKRLLADPRMSVSNIAIACRFSTHANFCKTFRRVTGMTPGDYRRGLERPASGQSMQWAAY